MPIHLNLIFPSIFNLTGYSAAALLAIVFAIPFAIRMYKDLSRWNNFGQAFYAAHLELFLGNGCLGIGNFWFK